MKLNFQAEITKEKKQIPTEAPGRTGTVIYGGIPYEKDFTPADLQFDERPESYEKMMATDAMIKASYMVVTLPIRAATWDIQPASDEPKDVEIADFIKEDLLESDLFNWDDWLRQALLYLAYGFYVFAKEYELKDRKYRLKRLSPRLPGTIKYWHRDKKTGDLETIEQYALNYEEMYDTYYLPRNQVVYLRHDVQGDDYRGQSILRTVYGCWLRKDHYLRIKAIGHERFAIPTLVIDLPEGFEDEDFDRAKEIGENYRAHEKGYIVRPPGWGIDFLSINKSQGDDINESIQSENSDILFNVLAQFINLGNTQTGARSVGEIHADLFYTALQFVCNDIAATLGYDYIRESVTVNFGEQQKYPKLIATKLQRPNIDTVLENLPKLVTSGTMETDEQIDAELRKIMDLPEKIEEEEPEEDIPPIVNPDDDVPDFVPAWDLKDSYWREMTDLEKAVNLSAIDRKLETEKKKLIKIGERHKGRMVKGLVKKGISLLSKKTNLVTFQQALKDMKVPQTGTFETDLRKELRELFKDGRKKVRAELDVTGKFQEPLDTVAEDPAEAQKAARARSSWAVATLAAVLKLEFDKEMQRQKERGVIDSDSLTAKLSAIVGADFNRVIKESVNKIYGLGRSTEALKQKDKIQKVIRSEILDENVCSECRPIDGQEMTLESAEFQRLSNGPNPDCHGEDLCRGVNIFVTA